MNRCQRRWSPRRCRSPGNDGDDDGDEDGDNDDDGDDDCDDNCGVDDGDVKWSFSFTNL